MREIVVLGAGYAGLTAATSLIGRTRRSRPAGEVRITVVDGNTSFTERLRLHQLATGQPLAERPYADLLTGPGVDLVTGEVAAIDMATRTVRLRDGRTLPFHFLVYGLGSRADTTGVPGATENGHTVDTAADASRLSRRLRELDGPATVVVCGAGLTGVETATEMAERHPALAVTLVGDREPGAALSPRPRAHLRAALDRLGVRVISGSTVTRVHPGKVELADGRTLTADVTVWTAGVRAPGPAGFATDDRGRIITDEMLRSVSHPEVYAVGDAAAIRQTYGVMHGTCQSGMPTGVQAALNISRELAGRPPTRFRYGYLHTAVSLGRHDAVVQFTGPDNSPGRFHLTGRVAVRYKETVTSSVWPSMARMLRLPGTGRLAWRRGGARTR
ncbi:NAD(P)/FAD-dependent oxidoreductase [Actinoplanes couchii]|uniref:Oxidoreductase n=1 Tax=Actinoplanes couchii TaxID=403638 RepID=A0ABQ3XFS4_9ACTN|nr:FAD-dependent oxidoreductase [Actinoplanes couchii]MDR6321688.1 NADH dehydrogenase FAD-containing subunit [Actinoplanes couchii]GID57356.1 oxidoreductase [Actinoplanes couchii]